MWAELTDLHETCSANAFQQDFETLLIKVERRNPSVRKNVIASEAGCLGEPDRKGECCGFRLDSPPFLECTADKMSGLRWPLDFGQGDKLVSL